MKTIKIVILITILTAAIGEGIYYMKSDKSIDNTNSNAVEVTDNSDSEISEDSNAENEEADDSEEDENVEYYDTSNINQFIKNDEIVSIKVGIETARYVSTEETTSRKKIQAVAKYLKSLKYVESKYKVVGQTPEHIIQFTDKSGKKYEIEYHGQTIGVFIDGEFLGHFIDIVDYDVLVGSDDLLRTCIEAGFKNEEGKEIPETYNNIRTPKSK